MQENLTKLTSHRKAAEKKFSLVGFHSFYLKNAFFELILDPE